jgi:hypothetical protein
MAFWSKRTSELIALMKRGADVRNVHGFSPSWKTVPAHMAPLSSLALL